MKFIFETLFFLLLVCIADIQARMIGDDKPIRHFWWGCLFAGLIGGAWWLEDRNNWFLTALVLEHFLFFAPALNYLRSPRKPFFYLSSQQKTGSMWDAFLLKVQPAYLFIWTAGLVGFVALQFFL